ncbi:hypothetical protein DFH08DRAFT_814447 [Mycena albidolilacea]|uniref:Uncharacterized protein n=1 Tax=Mycena albidolilacea TaxID=1033008 RepID=A0AAD6ZQ53_9AGAR|nr:hypothetical protein DFH08DRAFT_814447 [Mycena albidolilacea]
MYHSSLTSVGAAVINIWPAKAGLRGLVGLGKSQARALGPQRPGVVEFHAGDLRCELDRVLIGVCDQDAARMMQTQPSLFRSRALAPLSIVVLRVELGTYGMIGAQDWEGYSSVFAFGKLGDMTAFLGSKIEEGSRASGLGKYCGLDIRGPRPRLDSAELAHVSGRDCQQMTLTVTVNRMLHPKSRSLQAWYLLPLAQRRPPSAHILQTQINGTNLPCPSVKLVKILFAAAFPAHPLIPPPQMSTNSLELNEPLFPKPLVYILLLQVLPS